MTLKEIRSNCGNLQGQTLHASLLKVGPYQESAFFFPDGELRTENRMEFTVNDTKLHCFLWGLFLLLRKTDN
jgi:hypothetical protein